MLSRLTEQFRMHGVERQPVRKKSKATMIFFGSTIAVIGSLCAWSKSRNYIYLLASRFILQIKLHLLGTQAIYHDIRDAKYNRIDLPRKTGGIAIVTGGSRGIGIEVVRMLMKSDMEVIIACRNTEAGKKVISEIRETGVEEGKAVVYELDNTSFASVKKFADNVKRDYLKIDVLINNAGVMFPPYAETQDGFEQQWGINYLAHFLLTALMMPLLRNASTPTSYARVVSVSSIAHHLGTINFDDINYKNRWLTIEAYGQSKLATVMFTKTLQELFDENKLNIRAYSVHPGMVDTDLFQHTGLGSLKFLTKLMFKTPVQGATSIVYAALSEDIEDKGGIYISNCRPSPVKSLANVKAVRERLFKLSIQQTRLKDFLEYL